MPRKSDVDLHPQRRNIIRWLIQGVPYREITRRTGIKKDALSRFKNEVLVERAAKYDGDVDVRDASFLFDEIGDMIAHNRKVRRACARYLADPDDPDEFYLGPRAEEVKVVWWDRSKKKPELRTNTLAYLLDMVTSKVGPVRESESKHDDPRGLVLASQVANNKTLELLAKIQGKVADVNVNIVMNPVVVQMQQVIVEALDRHPEARRELTAALRRIVVGDSAGD